MNEGNVNKILPPFSNKDVQFAPKVLNQKIDDTKKETTQQITNTVTAATTPTTTQPVVDTSYFINTTNLTYQLSMDNMSNSVNLLAFDVAGSTNHGTNTAIACDGVAGIKINGYRGASNANFTMFNEAISGTETNIFLQGNGRIINAQHSGNIAYRKPADTSWTTYTTANYNAFDPLSDTLWIRNTATNNVSLFTVADTAPVALGALGLPAEYYPIIAGSNYIAARDTAKTFYLKSASNSANFDNKGTYPSADFTWPSGASDVRKYDIDTSGRVTYIDTASPYHLHRLNNNATVTKINLGRDTTNFELLTHKNLIDGSVIIAYSCPESAMISGGTSNRIFILDKYKNGVYSNVYVNNTTLKSTQTGTGHVKATKILESTPGTIIMLIYSQGATYQDTILRLTI